MTSSETTYLNHAGTSWPKPDCVEQAAARAATIDPLEWASTFRSHHETVAGFFHVPRERVLLTPGCTGALQLAIHDLRWQPGDRVVTSCWEHHALHRNLVQLEARGVVVERVGPGRHEALDLDLLADKLAAAGVRLLALTAACNVTGWRLPIERAIPIAREHGVPVLIDGAQIAGWYDLDLTELGADLFTFAGHKGLQAPWGIGGLYVASRLQMHCPTAVCELPKDSENVPPWAAMPGYCDAGSVDLVALAGLAAGCRWLQEPAQADRLARGRNMAAELTAACRAMAGVEVIHDEVPEAKMPTVAIRVNDWPSQELAQQLRRQGLVVAGGWQCAPLAHQSLGTESTGLVRFSFGPATPASAVDRAVATLQGCVGGSLPRGE